MTASKGILAPRRRWTADEDETLRINFPHFPAFLVAYVLGRTKFQVYNRAHALRLQKSPDYTKHPLAHLWNGTEHPNTVANRIKPGNVPANKGKRRPGWAVGRMAETQFKKGRPAHLARNYVPIGTEKYDPKRKVVVRKITDDPSVFPVMRWRPVHVLVWEAAHGPIPEGHICIFKPGMKTLDVAQITADRLEVVTLAENMRRNTLHNYPKDIARAIQTRAVLTRAINRTLKEQSQ
ncbi:HNH endonuclease [Pseudoxanthomonas sp. SE1]|uniref:HNH endonuclease n=1 Tax=Pseudoxanthomonas sp. SE1 TaxID=1664560 RepID=UPI00240DC59B|nr:HNH endonuclease [Pseudoxanthomonas sp. SE1]WFC43194.1 HNH endonuclease [Pseudoxanthomonas sp. SE1]